MSYTKLPKDLAKSLEDLYNVCCKATEKSLKVNQMFEKYNTPVELFDCSDTFGEFNEFSKHETTEELAMINNGESCNLNEIERVFIAYHNKKG